MINSGRFSRFVLSGLLLLAALAASAQQKPIKFAFIADTHYSEGSQSVQDLRACIRDVNSQNDIDFVIFGGDLTDFGTDEELASVKKMIDSLDIKYYVVAGNHDAKWSESGCNTFRKVFGYEHFDFEYGGWRFIGCNCGPDMRMAPALIPQESLVWLQSLKPGIKTLFVNHYPQDSTVLNYFDVTRQLKRIGTEFEIGGHFHSNVVRNYDGLPGILGRSSLSGGKSSGYSIITIDRDDHVTVSERKVFGSSSVQ
jgi:predicted phosphodiesterase